MRCSFLLCINEIYIFCVHCVKIIIVSHCYIGNYLYLCSANQIKNTAK